MKKIQNFFLMGTVALTGMAGLTACSSDNEPSDNNQPGVAGQVVKTQFALNIPYEGSTRMTASNTQANGKFLGIQNLQLLAFDKDPDNGATTVSTKSIAIGSGDNAYHKDMWRSVYRDVEIPIGTSNFVLYGRANRVDGTTDAKLGYLSMPTDYNTMTNLSNIKFNLKAIAPNANFSTDASAQQIVAQLNNLVGAKITAKAIKADGSVDESDTKEVCWKELENISDADANKYGLGSATERKTLKQRYDDVISLKAGSAVSVNALLQGLLDFFGDESAISDSKKMTKEIIRLTKEAKTALEDNKFPQNLNLPDGVANISWDGVNGTFKYSDTPSIGDNNQINYSKIAYPATLAYFISSPAMSSTKELGGVDALPNYKEWCQGSAVWSDKGFEEAAVSSATRSVALEKALQYGVASLKLSVRCADQNLEDNAMQKGYEKDNSIPVGGGFPVSAVLVGGQPSGVNWNMEASSDNGFDYTVYDTDMNVDQNNSFVAKYETSPSRYNYTLLLDNNNNENKGKVYVTVELTNNSMDFYGSDGLVPKGGKFYLVGELNVDAESGVTNKRDRVFEKDYTTTVNMNIKNLKNAYNCIPDLRSSKISLGLAVDMDWTTGITFDIDLK